MIQTPHTWIEISKQALLHNLAMYKKTIGSRALGVVIKSNAYGHGIIKTAAICQESQHADWLITGNLNEAMQCRAAGITKPILIVYFIDNDPQLLAKHDIDVMVADSDLLNELNAVGIGSGKKINIHLKFDTGMSRFGFMPHEAVAITKKAQSMPGVIVRGIYSHLAQAANADQTFTKEQERSFLEILAALEQENIQIPLIHLTNSAGTTTVLDSKINLVRIGLGAYGWWPSQSNKELTQTQFPDFELKPVLTFKTRIFQVRHLAANQYVGYDRTYKTAGPTKIAILPVGYYDGYDRRLSSKGILFIRGNYAPVIGIIAMTTTIVDITHIPDAQVGDEAILMGNYEKITPTQVANVIGSFNAREMMTRLNPTIPRLIVP